MHGRYLRRTFAGRRSRLLRDGPAPPLEDVKKGGLACVGVTNLIRRHLGLKIPIESGKWRIQAAPVDTESFAQRKSLPEPWRGLRDDALSKESGIDGCVFVHS